MKYTLSYRRPAAPWCLERMVVPGGESAGLQIKRLIALGYVVVEVCPPLEGKSF